MAILKCTKCNKEFSSGLIDSSKVSGSNGIYLGKWKVHPVWPFQMSLKAACPNCNEENKLLVVVNEKTKIITIIIILIVIILLFGVYLV